jgi:putative ABC transport system permease protein
MRTADTLRWGTKGIKQRRLRAALTILGIMIGTAAIIALTSQTQGIQVSIVGQIDKLGSNAITIRPTSSSVIFTQEDVDTISQIPGVSDVVPIRQSVVRLYGSGGARAFTVIGLDPDQFDKIIPGAEFSEGRSFAPESFSEILIGSNVKDPQDMTTPFLNVGQSVSVEIGSLSPVRKEVQVVGSLGSYGFSLISVDDSIFMTSGGIAALTGKSSYSAIYIKTTGTNADTQVTAYLKAIYGTTVSILSVSQITQIVSTITGLLTILLGAIAGISLFVAGVGIANIMFVSVVERTKEIGVLKALGFKGRDILSLFLSEAAVLGIVGGALGIVSGVAMSFAVPYLLTGSMGSSSLSQSGTGGFGGASSTSGQFGSSFSYTPVFSPELIGLVFLFAVGLSIIAGLYPARRASKMDPVVALRHE